jgi:hypothetical protein
MTAAPAARSNVEDRDEVILRMIPTMASAIDHIVRRELYEASAFALPPLRVRESLSFRLLSHMMSVRRAWVITEYYVPRADMLTSSAAKYEEGMGAIVSELGAGMKLLIAPEAPLEPQVWRETCGNFMHTFTRMLELQHNTDDKIMRDDLTMINTAYLSMFWEMVTQSENWDVALASPVDLERAMRVYNYDRSHGDFMDKGLGDPYCVAPIGLPMAVHCGNLQLWDATVDFTAKQFIRTTEDIKTNGRELQNHLYALGRYGLCIWYVLLKRPEVVRRLLGAAGLSWATVDAVVEAAPATVGVGRYPIVALERQPLNLIGNLA